MNRQISRKAILAAAPIAAVAMLGASVADPPQAKADVTGCVNTAGVEVCGSADVPSINDVKKVVPNVSVPNVNLPNVKVNPGHVGKPGRGR
ncbi:MAG: hypothetical protein K0U70_03905 [Actinomycetia bacterium]|nr:hypothetical protein [Actinomycetes bacterium]MCH9710811.1 hypothetical protein [Actinomycetes bacterium]MCH9766924.1 hypothetical protein [Actinomycetes bacterium]